MGMWVAVRLLFLSPFFFISSGMVEGGWVMQAYDGDTKAEALTPRACGSKGLVRFLILFLFCFIYL
jgi:hypothetical protein